MADVVSNGLETGCLLLELLDLALETFVLASQLLKFLVETLVLFAHVTGLGLELVSQVLQLLKLVKMKMKM